MVSHQVAVSELSRDDEYFVQFGARVISELSSLRSLGLLGEPVLVNEVPLLTGHR
jgi:hypothetical protein